MAFLGTYNYALDDKNRMRLPFKLRTFMGENFVILKGPANSLQVVTVEEFNNLKDMFKKVSYFNVQAQLYITSIIGSAFQPEEDAQGRFVLSHLYKEHAKINKKIVFVAGINRIDIYSEEVYNELFGSKTNSVDDAYAYFESLQQNSLEGK